MRYSVLFGKSVKDIPSDARNTSYQLLYKAGYIRESTAGRYFILPLGQIVQQKIMNIIKEEMDKIEGQEMLSPVLHPLSLWEETNRTKSTGYELMVVEDRRKAKFALGGTAEEMFIDIVRKFQISYKDLPFIIYQFSTKFRDELRARGGLLRVREFIMKDAYSFDRDEKDFTKTYELLKNAYSQIFTRLGLNTHIVESDNGYIGGDYCHEFIVDSDAGESDYFVTEDDSYASHSDTAVCDKNPINADEPLRPIEEINAIRGTTMKDGETFHKLPAWKQIKDVLYVDDRGRYILAIIRGDYDVNETKLRHVTNSYTLRLATDEEIRNMIHSEPGFLSPVSIKEICDKEIELIIVSDDSLEDIHNLYGGANKKNKDRLNMNIHRDFEPDIIADIMLVKEGDTHGGKKLIKKKGIEVGNIFQLGYYYSEKMHSSTFIDKNGEEKKYYMGCYGIGIGRTMSAIVEKHHDNNGILWPTAIAPYQVMLLNFARDNSFADKVYDFYKEQNIEVLYDDREDVSPGEKMKNADLLGIPFRIIVSEKTGEKVEVKKRKDKESSLMTKEESIEFLKNNL